MACPVVQYNGYEFPNVMGPYNFTYDSSHLKFSCNFLIKGTSASDLITKETTMLTATKEVKKTFYLSFNGKEEFSLSHLTTGGTGFNARAVVTKVANEALSLPLARQFSLSVDMDLPYTQDSGKIRADMSVSYSPSMQATANFSMVYSANTTQNALTVYQADTWVATMITAVFSGITMEKTASSWTQDQNQKTITARETYTQVMFNPSTDATVNTKVVNASLNFSLSYVSQTNAIITSADKKENLPMLELALSFQCFFDKNAVSSPNDMANIWKTNLRGRLLSQATDILKISGYSSYTNPVFFIKDERVQVNPSAYSLSANISVGCRASGTHIFSLEESIQITIDEGLVYVKLWDGRPNTFAIHTTGAVTTLNRSVRMSQLVTEPTIPALPQDYLLTSGKWLRLRNTLRKRGQYYGFSYVGSGSDNGRAEKVPIYTVDVSESYLCVDTAQSVFSIIGSVSTQTNTGYGG